MRKIRRWGAWLLLIIPLALNAQQRTEKLLNVPLPEHWQEEDAMFQQQLPVDDHWWTVFQDATLDSLIHVAVRQNPSVLTALNRIDMAKANLRIARGAIIRLCHWMPGGTANRLVVIPVRDSLNPEWGIMMQRLI